MDYYVDEYKQYHADVKYEGEICYHEEPKKPHHGYVECIRWCQTGEFMAKNGFLEIKNHPKQLLIEIEGLRAWVVL